nr:hypothetical protein [uncultured Mucilaginibacter sp.]
MRKYLTGIWLLFLTIAAGTMFWYTSWQYSKPAPESEGYKILRGGELNRKSIANAHPVQFIQTQKIHSNLK